MEEELEEQRVDTKGRLTEAPKETQAVLKLVNYLG